MLSGQTGQYYVKIIRAREGICCPDQSVKVLANCKMYL